MKEDADKKLAELTQAEFPRRRQTLILYPDRIELTVRTLTDRQRVPFYLHSIKDEPDRVLAVPWGRLLLGAILLAAAAAMAWAPGVLRHPGGAVAAAAIGTLWTLSQLLKIRRFVIYFYRPVQVGWKTRLKPQLFLHAAKPSADEVERFVEAVAGAQKRHLAKVREETGEEPVAYTRELERFAELRELKVLTDEEFARIKAKLLNIKQRRIGF